MGEEAGAGTSMEVVASVHERGREGDTQKLLDKDVKEKERPLGAGAAGCFFSHFFSVDHTVRKIPENDLLSARRLSTTTSIPLTLPQEATQSSVRNITHDDESDCKVMHFNGVGRGFLTALADIWLGGTIRGEGEKP